MKKKRGDSNTPPLSTLKSFMSKSNLSLSFRPIHYICFWKCKGDMRSIGKLRVVIQAFSGRISLNSVASFVWLLCDGNNKISEIIKKVHSPFPDVSREIIKSDVLNLLNRFEQDDLIIIDYNPLYPYKELHCFRKDKIK